MGYPEVKPEQLGHHHFTPYRNMYDLEYYRMLFEQECTWSRAQGPLCDRNPNTLIHRSSVASLFSEGGEALVFRWVLKQWVAPM